MKTTNINNWSDLKEFVQSLSEAELQQPVITWGESYSKRVHSISIMTEDMINPSGDGCEPLSAYTDDSDYTDMVDEPVIVKKGEIRIDAYFDFEPYNHEQ